MVARKYNLGNSVPDVRVRRMSSGMSWASAELMWDTDNSPSTVSRGFSKFLQRAAAIPSTIPRDVSALYRLIKLKLAVRRSIRANLGVPKVFDELVRKHPNKACFVFEGRTWTYQQVDELSNRVANVFHNLGYRKGDVVALFMESRPEFVCVWLGLAKIGAVTALINFNLRSQPLAHSIIVAEAKGAVYGTELTEAIEEVRPQLPENLQYFYSGDAASSRGPGQSLDALLSAAAKTDPPYVPVTVTDRLVYIYTSGTTGLPKAAVITHARYEFMVFGICKMQGLQQDDIIYDPLPLYHSAGGALGVGQAILNGITVVIRKKFSASRFWDDCIANKCTVAQYIGEICRYLLSQPERPEDRQHSVRCMYGNGLRPQIWQAFVDRFGVKYIGEFYGATEGNANIVNIDNRVGAVGFLSRIAPFIYPVALIRVDEDSGEPIRGKNGLCIKCRPGEPGEFVGKIVRNDPVREFEGYVNKQATEKKLVKDVFSKGDMAFLSGDILQMDEFGYIYFKDRTGDTFRWKGENVSTAEIEAVISNSIGLKDCVVYGVEVPGQEGRAGMAAILDPEHTLDMQDLTQALQKNLAAYARPLFLRIVEKLPMTGTYKLKKVDLQREGYNPTACHATDILLYLDLKSGQYKPLDSQAYSDICSGKIRL